MGVKSLNQIVLVLCMCILAQYGLARTPTIPDCLEAIPLHSNFYEAGESESIFKVLPTITITEPCLSDIDYNPQLEHFPCSTNIPYTIGEDIGSDITYAWSTGSSSPTIAVTNAGSYMVTVSNDCEEVTRTINVEFEVAPVGGYVVDDFILCEGESEVVGFTMTSNSEIVWVGPSGNSSSSSYTIDTPGAYGFVINNTCGGFDGNFDVINGVSDIEITGMLRACAGETTMITASGGASYLWSSGETTASIEALAGENYTVEVTTAAGCTATESIAIAEDTGNNITIEGARAFCAGENTRLNVIGANPMDTYLWSTGANTASITVNQGGTYSVTVRTIAGCEVIQQVPVTENPRPSITIQNNAACNPSLADYDMTLSIAAGLELSTNDPMVMITENNDIYTLTAFTGSSYEITVRDPNTGCTFMQPITAPNCNCDPIALPNTTQTEASYCEGEPIPEISASVGVGFEIVWYTLASGGVPIEIGDTLQPMSAGIYHAESREVVSGCMGGTRLAIEVIERALPQIGFGNNLSVCVGEELSLTATGGTNYTWDSGENTTTITAGAGLHSVTIVDDNGCENSNSVTIEEFPEPTATIAGDTAFCAGMETMLTGMGGINYIWSIGESSTTINVSQSRTVRLTVIDGNGCQAEASQEIIQYTLPRLITQQAATCSDNLTEYTVVGTITPNATLETSTGTINETNGVYTITVPQGINVEYTVTNIDTGCARTETIGSPDCDCAVLAAPNGIQELFYCAGDNNLPMLTARASESGTQIQWYDVESGGAPIGMGNEFQPIEAGTYYAETLETVSSCVSTTRLSIQLTERPAPVITFNEDRMVCPDEMVLLLASGGLSYEWSTGIGSAGIIVGVGNYTVTATDANGCTNEADISITNFELPTASISGNTQLCAGGEITLTASGGLGYEWSTNEDSEVITINEAGDISLIVTDENGCQDETSVTIIQNELPIFTTQQAATCTEDRTEYTITATLSDNTTLTTSAGVVDEANGVYTITIPEGINVDYTVTNSNTGCSITENISAPDCSCPVLATPNGGQEFFYCAGDTNLPMLSATASETGTEIQWYNVESGGAPIGMGNDFQPTAAGTYYAETIEAVSNCVSSTRLMVQVTERTRPLISFSEERMVCPDETLLLTASGGLMYEWNTNATSATITAAVGDYQVTVSDENGCTNEAMVSIASFTPPTAVITGNEAFCEGENTILTASGGLTYEWSTNAMSDIIIVEETSDVSVTVTDENGCQEETSISIVENELPMFITQQAALCTEDRTQYTVTATISENASLATTAGTASEANGIYTITIPADISIEVEVTNTLTGCVQNFPINAPDCSCPVLAAPTNEGDIEICAGSTIPALSVGVEDAETTTVNWYADAAGTIALANATLEYTPDVIGTYFAQTIEVGSGCVSSQLTAVSLSELSLPVIAFSEANQVCPDETLILTASGGIDYTWSTDETIASIEVGAGMYSVTATDANNCENEASITINEFMPPTAVISGDESYCAGEQVSLMGSGGILAWNTGESSDQIQVTAGEFTLTVTDENACTDTAIWTVTENELPTLTLTNSIACTPDLTEYDFTASVSDNAEVSMSAGTFSENDGQYFFTIPEGINAQITLTNTLTQCSDVFDISAPTCDCPSLNAPTSMGDVAICMSDAIPGLMAEGGTEDLVIDWYNAPIGGTLLAEGSSSFTATEAGSYYAELREVASGCTSSLRTEIALMINDLPAISIEGDDAICANESSTLNAIGVGDFVWSTNEMGSSITAAEGGSYSVTLTDSNACESSARFNVQAIASPIAEILDAPSTLCENEMATLRASGVGEYQWSTGEIGNSININSEGMYSLSVTNSEGCSDMTSVAIVLNDVDAIQVELGEDRAICEGESVLLNAGNFPDVSYSWRNGSTAASLEATEEGLYAVTLTDACDNSYEDQVRLSTVSTITNADVEAIVGQDTSLCRGIVLLNVANLNIENIGNLNYTWTGGSNAERFQIQEAGTYALRMSNECGVAFAEVEVAACPECHIYVPNTFNPSSLSAQNQRFRPFLGNDCEVTNYQFRIFNRWGELVFETTDLTAAWNGQFRNQNPVKGVYVWVMTYEMLDRYGKLREQTDTGDVTVFKY